MDEAAAIASLLRGDAQSLVDEAAAALQASDKRRTRAQVAYFEPRMRDQQGHFAMLADAYAGRCSHAGIGMNVYHHQSWNHHQETHWHGVFPVSDHLIGSAFGATPAILQSFTHYIHDVVEACAVRSEARLGIFPTARYLTLPGIAQAVSNVGGIRGAIIGVMETMPVPDCENAEVVISAFKDAARTLKRSGKPVLLIAESEAIGEWLKCQGFDHDQLMTAPYPAAARFLNGPPQEDRDKRLRLGALGATRPVHNPGLLAKFLLSADLEDCRWTVRLNLELAASQLGMASESLGDALHGRGIELLPMYLAREAYDQALRSVDVMLLSYGDRYQLIGSGIFLECLCAGVIPLVPEGSVMRRLYRELGGTAPALHAASVEEIANAVQLVSRQIEPLRSNAQAVRENWLIQPGGPRNWKRRVDAFIKDVCQQ